MKNYVVAPVALNGRRKTDQRDAGKLREQLERYVREHKKAFSVVHVPTSEQEQDRALVRHREALARELARCAQRGRSLCLAAGATRARELVGQTPLARAERPVRD